MTFGSFFSEYFSGNGCQFIYPQIELIKVFDTNQYGTCITFPVYVLYILKNFAKYILFQD